MAETQPTTAALPHRTAPLAPLPPGQKKKASAGPPWTSRAVLTRDEGLAKEGRGQVVPLLELSGAPEPVLVDAKIIVTEALTNATKYGDVGCGWVTAFCHVRPGRLVLVYRYLTERFDPNPAPPDDTVPVEQLQLRGRGIWMIRALAEDGGGGAEWRFRPDGAGRVSRAARPLFRLTLVLTKRW